MARRESGGVEPPTWDHLSVSLRKREKAEGKQNENTTRTLSHGQAILRQRLWGLQSAACDALLTTTALQRCTLYILGTLWFPSGLPETLVKATSA